MLQELRKLPRGSWCSWAGEVDWCLEASRRSNNAVFLAIRGFGGICLAALARRTAIAHQLGLHPSTTLPLLLPCPVHFPTATSVSMPLSPTDPHARKSCLNPPEFSQTPSLTDKHCLIPLHYPPLSSSQAFLQSLEMQRSPPTTGLLHCCHLQCLGLPTLLPHPFL